jgi:ABC-2 type transport system permease protein
MYNLSNVVKFEIIRTLKKPSFWVAAILLPLLLVGYVGISGMMGYNANKAIEEAGDISGKKVAITDDTGLVELPKDSHISIIKDKSIGLSKVKQGKIDIYYYVPKDLSNEHPAEVYTNTDSSSIFENYDNGLRSLLMASALGHTTPVDALVLSNTYQIKTTNFDQNGEDKNTLGKLTIPIITLAIFYVLVCMFGNRLMMSTIEEKENRISEMILTSIKSRTLIIGKIISLITLGFLQILILSIPIIVGYLNAKSIAVGGLNVGDILPHIVFDPATITLSVLLLISSYILFTGLCVTIGTLVPSAKEASNYMAVVMILVILPLFFLNSFIGQAPDTMTYILSYFPFTAPISLLLRGAFGTLPPLDAVIGIAIISISAALVIALAIKIFRSSAVEYTSKVNILRVLRGDK